MSTASRETISFGEGSIIGQIAADPSFFDLSVRDQARLTGWADGCPVVEELTDPNNTAPGRGSEAMLNRYSEVNFWFGQISREARRKNPDLAQWLGSSVVRKKSEPVGKHEPESVPDSHEWLMAPMGTLAGYALPRIFVEQLKPADAPAEEMPQRMARGLEVVRDAIAKTAERRVPASPLDLMALVAEGLTQADADPMKVLRHIVGRGWMEEHNSPAMLRKAKQSLKKNAPKLWDVYKNLTREQKAEYRFV